MELLQKYGLATIIGVAVKKAGSMYTAGLYFFNLFLIIQFKRFFSSIELGPILRQENQQRPRKPDLPTVHRCRFE